MSFTKCSRCGVEHNPFQACPDLAEKVSADVTNPANTATNPATNRVYAWRAKHLDRYRTTQRELMRKHRGAKKVS